MPPRGKKKGTACARGASTDIADSTTRKKSGATTLDENPSGLRDLTSKMGSAIMTLAPEVPPQLKEDNREKAHELSHEDDDENNCSISKAKKLGPRSISAKRYKHLENDSRSLPLHEESECNSDEESDVMLADDHVPTNMWKAVANINGKQAGVEIFRREYPNNAKYFEVIPEGSKSVKDFLRCLPREQLVGGKYSFVVVNGRENSPNPTMLVVNGVFGKARQFASSFEEMLDSEDVRLRSALPSNIGVYAAKTPKALPASTVNIVTPKSLPRSANVSTPRDEATVVGCKLVGAATGFAQGATPKARGRASREVTDLLRDASVRMEMMADCGHFAWGTQGLSLQVTSARGKVGIPQLVKNMLRFYALQQNMSMGTITIDFNQDGENRRAPEAREFYRHLQVENLVLKKSLPSLKSNRAALVIFGLDSSDRLFIGKECFPNPEILPADLEPLYGIVPAEQPEPIVSKVSLKKSKKKKKKARSTPEKDRVEDDVDDKYDEREHRRKRKQMKKAHQKALKMDKLRRDAEAAYYESPEYKPSPLSCGVGPGLLNPSAITDEWVKENPLFVGEGCGIFKHMSAPTNVSEWWGCVATLIAEMYAKGGYKESGSFQSRAMLFLRDLRAKGATWENFKSDFLQNRKCAYVYAIGLLFNYVRGNTDFGIDESITEEELDTDGATISRKRRPEAIRTHTKSASFWMYRFHIAVSQWWESFSPSSPSEGTFRMTVNADARAFSDFSDSEAEVSEPQEEEYNSEDDITKFYFN